MEIKEAINFASAPFFPDTWTENGATAKFGFMRESEQWQEVDLNEHIHNELEMELLRNICKRKNNNKPPQNIRLLFK